MKRTSLATALWMLSIPSTNTGTMVVTAQTIVGPLHHSEECVALSSALPDCMEPFIVKCGDEGLPECSASSTRFDIRCFACKNAFKEMALSFKEKCRAIRSALPLADCPLGSIVYQCSGSTATPQCASREEEVVCQDTASTVAESTIKSDTNNHHAGTTVCRPPEVELNIIPQGGSTGIFTMPPTTTPEEEEEPDELTMAPNNNETESDQEHAGGLDLPDTDSTIFVASPPVHHSGGATLVRSFTPLFLVGSALIGEFMV